MNTQAHTRVLFPATPPLLNAAALLFWGWQCDFMAYAVCMAVALELPRILPTRINLSDNEFNHVSDLSAIIFLLAIIYIFINWSFHGIFRLLAALPFLFYLLVLAQRFSTQGYIRASALFISLRRCKAGNSDINPGLDLSFPYFLVCLLSASEGQAGETLYYPVLVILVGWALWSIRPARASLAGWVLIILLSIPSAYMMQNGLQQLQAAAEATVLAWIDQFMWRSRDPQRTSTAIGTLGKLKLSDRITVRVRTDREIPQNEVLLLRESSYLDYSHGMWTNFQNTLQLVDPEPGGRRWVLNPGIQPVEQITISFPLDDEAAIIPLPIGTHAIFNVTSSEVLHSPYGTTSLELNPGWIKYDVAYIPDLHAVSEPGRDELQIPDIYEKELRQLADSLDLPRQSAQEAIATTRRFFRDNFSYSLTQRQRYPRGRYLTKFLFETRTGHCEFFATATALLLRAANIPTRYIVGYAVQEYSELENLYIARASHAHSWVEAYVGDEWLTLDTTPPVWIAEENADASAITPLVDFWSWLTYKLAVDDSESGEDDSNILLWLLLPALLYYLWRIFNNRQAAPGKSRAPPGMQAVKPGTDSAYYRLCRELEKIHGPRADGQTQYQWLVSLSGKIRREDILPLLQLHYRYRFDPDGLDADEIREMQRRVDRVINTLA